MKYDLVIIGSGPAGQKGAMCAAKMGKRVAVIERCEPHVGGACLHTGTIPSKAMREAILQETARGQIDGDHSGMIKLLFHREMRQLLGVHGFGTRATELVHIGQAVMHSMVRWTTSATSSSTIRRWVNATK